MQWQPTDRRRKEGAKRKQSIKRNVFILNPNYLLKRCASSKQNNINRTLYVNYTGIKKIIK